MCLDFFLTLACNIILVQQIIDIFKSSIKRSTRNLLYYCTARLAVASEPLRKPDTCATSNIFFFVASLVVRSTLVCLSVCVVCTVHYSSTTCHINSLPFVSKNPSWKYSKCPLIQLEKWFERKRYVNLNFIIVLCQCDCFIKGAMT